MGITTPGKGEASAAWPALVPLGHLEGRAPIPLHRAVTLVGAGKYAHLHLLSQQVSQTHAVIVCADRSIYIRDTASRARIFVNDKPVRQAQLRDGDVLRIAEFSFRVKTDWDGQVPAVPDAVLELQDGGLPMALGDWTTLIGKRSICDVPLASDEVSTVHAIIMSVGGKHLIRDLNTRWGTYINGSKIHQAELSFGDEIQVAGNSLRYTAAPAVSQSGTTLAAPDTPVLVAASAEVLVDAADLSAEQELMEEATPEETVFPADAMPPHPTPEPQPAAEEAPAAPDQSPSDISMEGTPESAQPQPVDSAEVSEEPAIPIAPEAETAEPVEAPSEAPAEEELPPIPVAAEEPALADEPVPQEFLPHAEATEPLPEAPQGEGAWTQAPLPAVAVELAQDIEAAPVAHEEPELSLAGAADEAVEPIAEVQPAAELPMPLPADIDSDVSSGAAAHLVETDLRLPELELAAFEPPGQTRTAAASNVEVTLPALELGAVEPDITTRTPAVVDASSALSFDLASDPQTAAGGTVATVAEIADIPLTFAAPSDAGIATLPDIAVEVEQPLLTDVTETPPSAFAPIEPESATPPLDVAAAVEEAPWPAEIEPAQPVDLAPTPDIEIEEEAATESSVQMQQEPHSALAAPTEEIEPALQEPEQVVEPPAPRIEPEEVGQQEIASEETESSIGEELESQEAEVMPPAEEMQEPAAFQQPLEADEEIAVEPVESGIGHEEEADATAVMPPPDEMQESTAPEEAPEPQSPVVSETAPLSSDETLPIPGAEDELAPLPQAEHETATDLVPDELAEVSPQEQVPSAPLMEQPTEPAPPQDISEQEPPPPPAAQEPQTKRRRWSIFGRRTEQPTEPRVLEEWAAEEAPAPPPAQTTPAPQEMEPPASDDLAMEALEAPEAPPEIVAPVPQAPPEDEPLPEAKLPAAEVPSPQPQSLPPPQAPSLPAPSALGLDARGLNLGAEDLSFLGGMPMHWGPGALEKPAPEAPKAPAQAPLAPSAAPARPKLPSMTGHVMEGLPPEDDSVAVDSAFNSFEASAAAFQGLAMPPLRDVFSALPTPAETDPVFGKSSAIPAISPVQQRGRSEIEAARMSGDEARPPALPLPAFSMKADSPAPREDAENQEQADMEMEPEAPAVPRRSRRLSAVRLLLILMLLCMIAAVVIVWLWVPVWERVQGTLIFRSTEALTMRERQLLRDEQRRTLFDDQTRATAAQIVSAQQPQVSPGFLSSTVEFARVANEAESNGFWPDERKDDFTFRMDSSAAAADVLRVRALITALYLSPANAARVALLGKAKQVGELEKEAEQIKKRIGALDEQIIEQDRLAKGRPDDSQMHALEDAVKHKETAWESAVARAFALKKQIESAAALEAARQQAATQPAPIDAELVKLDAELADVNKAMGAARAGGHSDVEQARRQLDAAIEQFGVQSAAAAERAKDSPQMRAYLSAANDLREATKRLAGELIQSQKEQNDRIAEFKRSLDDALEAQRNKAWKNDAQLGSLTEQLAIARRKYNAVLAAGEGRDQDRDTLKSQIQKLEDAVTRRQSVLTQDSAYSELVLQLQKLISFNEKRLEEDRQRAQQTVDALQSTLEAASPATQKLPDDQKAMAVELQKRMTEMNAARRLYSSALEKQGTANDQLVAHLRDKAGDLRSRIAARRREIEASAPTTATAEAASAAVTQMQAALAEAEKTAADAKGSLLKAQLDLVVAGQSRQNADAAIELRDKLKAQRSAAAQEMDRLDKQVAHSGLSGRAVLYPEEPTEQNFTRAPQADPRGRLALASIGVIACTFMALIWVMARTPAMPTGLPQRIPAAFAQPLEPRRIP